MRPVKYVFKEFDLVTSAGIIAAMDGKQIDKVRRLEAVVLQEPQIDLEYGHVLHGGLYARTVKIPAGVMITGTLIKIPTVLIFDGDAMVYVGEESMRLTGRQVLSAEANRKQVFVALKDSWLTMLFPSNAKNVKDAEEQFTDEWSLLASRRAGQSNTVSISGEISCQESPQLPLSPELLQPPR